MTARRFREMCEQDFLFFVNSFCWTYDPRLETPEVPFLTYSFQDEALMTLQDCCGSEDVVIEKSRAMGATWMFLLIFFYRWMFKRNQTFLIVSRNMDLVDKTDDKDCLFWKLDFLLEHLPSWLRPKFRRIKGHLGNDESKSTIDGSATTGDVARGGRRTALALDEFASFSFKDGFDALAATQSVTNCRFFNSTPKGMNNAHYKMVSSGMKKLRMHWSSHPEMRKGLYTSSRGRLELIDKAFWVQQASEKEGVDYSVDEVPRLLSEGVLNYPFEKDDKIRSPWYDKECHRMQIKSLIAQEFDIDYSGAGDPVFAVSDLEKVAHKYCLPALRIGELEFDRRTFLPTGFRETSAGRFKLWIYPDNHNEFPTNRIYVLGADISFGTGASESCISVYDYRTKTKVLEFAHNKTGPTDLASIAYALGHWFMGQDSTPAFAIWESNGPGRTFGSRLLELGYPNVFYRTNEQAYRSRRTDFPGWHSTLEFKSDLILQYGTAVLNGNIINRSKRAVLQLGEYIYLETGGIGHGQLGDLRSPSDAKSGHGDLVVADMMCYRGFKEFSSQSIQEDRIDGSERHGSFALRRKSYREGRKTSRGWLAPRNWEAVA